MRLASYVQAGEDRLGAVLDGTYVDLNRAYASLRRSTGSATPQADADAAVPADILAFLTVGSSAVQGSAEALDHVASLGDEAARRNLLVADADAVKLLPPVPRPPKMICIARNYAEHAREAGFEISEIPIVFPRFSATLVAHGEPVVRPTVSDQLDWEGELAIVIGRPGRAIKHADAIDYVAGYTIFNDITVRDYQFRVTQYTAGKNFRYTGPLGPYLVLKDEVKDPDALDITLEVNGDTKQSANTSDMIYDVGTIIEHISEWIDLEPGDVIPTGTPAGVGFKRNPPEFLVPGDTVSVAVQGLGTLSNPVIAEEDLQ